MTEREAFTAAVAASPDDDTVRLAFADWLQEHGEDARAEFIRLQCELARRTPSAEQSEDAYSSYPQHPTYSNNEEARAAELLLSHWPEWFGALLSAVGMPKPGPAVAPQQAWGSWRGPPYAVGAHGPPLRYLPLVFEDELSSRRRRRARAPKRFLNSLRLDRGFVVGLNGVVANRTARCSLAAALRLEPITGLALRLSTNPDHWAQLSHPTLMRVRDLELTFLGSFPLPYFCTAVGALLNDPALNGVRSLSLLTPHENETGYNFQSPLSRDEVEVVLASPVAWGLRSLSANLVLGAAAAFDDTEPLPDLRALWLHFYTGSESMVLSLPAYRDQLERLTVTGGFDVNALGRGRPWARLTALRLDRSTVGVAGCAVLADPHTFPVLTQLRIASQSVDTAGALAGALRAGRFATLTALTFAGRTSGALVALAEAVAPTGIRELDLRGVWSHTEAEYERVRELLGDRVRIDPPGDAIPF